MSQRWKKSQKNDFSNDSPSNLKDTTPNSEPTDDSNATIKHCVDSVSGNKRNTRDLSVFMNNQGIEINDNNLIEINSISENIYPISAKQTADTKYVDDNIANGRLVRFNAALEKFSKVTIGDTVYNLTKNNTEPITDTTVILYPNTGGYLLQQRNIKCNDKTNSGKIKKLYKINNNK